MRRPSIGSTRTTTIKTTYSGLTEADEQEALFDWARVRICKYPELRLLHHIPNGGSRNPIEAARLKGQGVKPGVPDLCLPVARGGFHGLYIEMKRRKGGRISPEQEAWLRELRKQGFRAEVCRGWEEAKNTLEEYLEGGS